VDDNLEYAENIAEILDIHGWRTRVAASAEEALSTALTAPCDVLLTDFRLPGMNGVQLIESLRRQDLKPVAIVMTAYASEETESFTRKVGARLLHKPLSLMGLNQLIRDERGSA
jgi:DNA-binding response OmpR family regulator